MTFGLDADFSEASFVTRLNADLANDLGNLVSRATTLIVNFAAGAGAPGPATAEEETVRAAAAEARRQVEEAMGDFAFHRALAAIWEFIGTVNRYVDTTQPWSLAKKPAERPRLDRVLLTLADAVRLPRHRPGSVRPDGGGEDPRSPRRHRRAAPGRRRARPPRPPAARAEALRPLPTL